MDNLRIKQKKAKSISLIPIGVTGFNVLLGISALFLISKGSLKAVFLIVLLAALFDFLDGFLARKMNSETRLGSILDSVSDLVCFVAVPAFYILTVSGGNNSLFLNLSLALYLSAGTARLVRYTVSVLSSENSKGVFLGLPVTAAAILVMSSGCCLNTAFQSLILIICGFLMVTKVKYTAFSKLMAVKGRKMFLALIISLPFLVFYPLYVVFVFSSAYAAFYPLSGLFQYGRV